MKSYNGLRELTLSDDTIMSGIKKAAKGKTKNNSRHRFLRYVKKHCDEYKPIVREWIINYDPKKYNRTTKVINDGISAKKRELTIPTKEEEIILNVVMVVLKQIMKPSMYEHSYSSIPGRGVYKATKYITKWLNRDCTGTKYALQMDIQQFFKSVDLNVLRNKLQKLIKDKWFYRLLDEILSVQEKGLPLGFPTSQWFANYSLNKLDHYIKEDLKAPYYVRFSDDMLILASNKLFLFNSKDEIERYLNDELHLNLKPNWKIFPVDLASPSLKGPPLDFIGYKHYRDYVFLRKKTLRKCKRKIAHVKKKQHINIKDARQLITYAGYLKHANCYGWYKKYYRPYVSVRYLRKKISKYSKKGRDHECGTKQCAI